MTIFASAHSPTHSTLRWKSPRALPFLVVALVAVLLSGAAPACAQSDDTNRVASGDTVRVRMDGGLSVEAAFRSWDGPSMVLSVEGLTEPWTVSVYDMHTLEVFTQRTSPEGFRHGAVLGAVAGMFLGAATGAVLNLSGVTDDPSAPADQVVNQSIRGAVIGAAIGGLSLGIYRGRNPGRGWIGLELPELPPN
jgi:uncharacterized protein YcfJ